ncbi:hypothetical protein GCM10008932_17400 [Alkalibacterium iburiense]|uniref:Uncharacterized protein n=1 Tax=Alkalibacterium iburiense TaxID=290589 RepID=A0ABP3HDL7_9LACT
MDYNRFMQKIDKQINKMDEQTLRSWIRNYARKLPENSRTHFLEKFNSSEVEDKQTLLARLQNVEEWIDSVRSAEVFIYLVLNEYYDDWHHEPEDEFIDVKDPLDVFERFKDSCQLVEDLVERGMYQETDQLLSELIAIDVLAYAVLEDEYDDVHYDTTFENTELFEQTYTDRDVFIRLWLYAIAMGYTGEERLKKLYKVMKAHNIIDIDKMKTAGKVEVDTESFVDEWIEFLITQPGRHAYDSLVQVCASYKDLNYLEENIERFGQQHPQLYLNVLANKLDLEYTEERLNDWRLVAWFKPNEVEAKIKKLSQKECEDILSFIHFAKEKMPDGSFIKSDVMEIGYVIASHLNHFSDMKLFRKLAFVHRSSPINYLRLRPHLNPGEEVEAVIHVWSNDVPKVDNPRKPDKHLTENKLTDNEYSSIPFFTGNSYEYYLKCKENKITLGWSYDSLGLAVPLLLLLRRETDEETPVKGIIEDEIRSRLVTHPRDQVYFSRAFRQLKHTTSLSEVEKEEILKWIKQTIDKRTEALLSEKLRNSYHKAAELIIAYGEVIESMGNLGAKEKIANDYLKKYSRFNRFRKEVKELL